MGPWFFDHADLSPASGRDAGEDGTLDGGPPA